jgi:hypothetical protein
LIDGKPKIDKKRIHFKPIFNTIEPYMYSLARFLTEKLQSFIQKYPSFIKDSFDFFQKYQNFHLDEKYIMVTFDVLSLFTKILFLESLNLLFKLVELETLNVIEIDLTSTFFFPSKEFSMNKHRVHTTTMGHAYL